MPIMPNSIMSDKKSTMTILLGIHIKYYYIYRIYIIKVFFNLKSKHSKY